MTAYRFRVKAERGSNPFWRDIVVGSGRTLAEFRETIDDAIGLDGDRLWFFGTDRDYWESPIKYQSHYEYTELSSGGSMRWDEDVLDASETPIRYLGLDTWDRLCYLYDYVEEHRFYVIVADVLDGEPDDAWPEVVGERGDATHLDRRVAVSPRE